MKINQKLFMSFIFLCGLIAIGFSGSALAISSSSVHCNQTAKNKINQDSNYATTQDEKRFNNYQHSLNKLSNSTLSKIKSCADLTNPASFFHIPTITNLIGDLKRKAKQAACDKARSLVTQNMGSYTKSLSINTGIPGINTVGGSAHFSPYGGSAGFYGAGQSATASGSSGF